MSDKQKFTLNLESYKTLDLSVRSKTPPEIDYPVRANYAAWLRSPGMFRTGEDVAEAVVLAHKILECEGQFVEIDKRQLQLLRAAINRLLELTADGRAGVGGEMHEEAICRVFNLK